MFTVQNKKFFFEHHWTCTHIYLICLIICHMTENRIKPILRFLFILEIQTTISTPSQSSSQTVWKASLVFTNSVGRKLYNLYSLMHSAKLLLVTGSHSCHPTTWIPWASHYWQPMTKATSTTYRFGSHSCPPALILCDDMTNNNRNKNLGLQFSRLLLR